MPDIQVKPHAANSQRACPRLFCVCVWSLHSVTYGGNVSSKRACVWDLEILLLSGMLVVKTTGCKGIWPSLGSRGIIGWFHTKVNCSNVKSGKTGTFRNKTYAGGRWFSFLFFHWGLSDFFLQKLKEGECHLSALALIRFWIYRACLLCWGCLLWFTLVGMCSELRRSQAGIIEGGEGQAHTVEWHCVYSSLMQIQLFALSRK